MTRYCPKCDNDKPAEDFYPYAGAFALWAANFTPEKESWCMLCRRIYQGAFRMKTGDMFFLHQAGCTEWESWKTSPIFQRMIDAYGTGEDKKRLAALNVGYHYEPISTEITPEDRTFLADCGIRCTHDRETDCEIDSRRTG
jgi:hypothetical protein